MRTATLFFARLLIVCLLVSTTLLDVLAQPFTEGQTTVTFVDASRSNRSIGVDLRYPAQADGTTLATGTFPVVVFGHGFTIGTDSYDHLVSALVPEGYFVAMPTTESGFSPDHANFGLDLAFVAAEIQAENANSGSFFFGAVAPETAIMGHSMGGGSAFLAANGNTDITTLVTYAAAETTPSAISAAAGVSVPSLVVAGAEDCVTPNGDHQYPMYTNTGSACNVYYEIEEASHCHFSDGDASSCYAAEGFSCLFGWGPFLSQADQTTMVHNAVLPWLDFYLKNECASWGDFQTYMTTGTGFSYESPDISCGVTPPVATATAANTNICGGESTLLTATGGASYAWDNATTLDDATSATPTASPLTNTTYTVTVTDANGCTDTENVSINVLLPPTASISPTSSTICPGESVTLTAAGGTDFIWSDFSTANTLTVSPAGTTDYFVTVSDANGCEDEEMVSITVLPDCNVVVQLSAVLEGAFDGASGLMRTDLLTNNLLPEDQPYDVAPWNYAGTENVPAADLPTNTVDWVLVEVQDLGGNILESRAALLLDNGQVVDVDGITNGVNFFNLSYNSTYNFVLRHRNHLDIASATPVAPTALTVIDFTDIANVLDNGTPQVVDVDGAGLHALRTGDITADGRILVDDLNTYLAESSAIISYIASDCNMDVNVTVADFNIYQPNAGVLGVSLVTY